MKNYMLATTSLPMAVASFIKEIEDDHIGLCANIRDNIRAELKVGIAESLASHMDLNIHDGLVGDEVDDAVSRNKFNPRHPRNNNGGHITRGGYRS